MNKVQNLQQAKELVIKYRSITAEDIEKCGKIGGGKILQKLTGFGDYRMCTLCLSVDDICANCIHSISKEEYYGCPCATITYDNIRESMHIHSLLAAIAARANYLESLINKYELKKQLIK